MTFHEFAKTLQKLEDTSKRLEITSILTELISKLEIEEIDNAINLLLGQLKAPFDDKKFNIADKMMIKILEFTFSDGTKGNLLDKIVEMYQQNGDLGSTAYALTPPQKSSTLTITEVYERLYQLANIEGTGSQENKIKKASTLIKSLDPLSSKFVVRIILGTTRLGFTELTLLDALALYLNDKNLKKRLEAVYNIHPDIAIIIKNIKQKGIKGIDLVQIETGIPILAQKAQRIGSSEEIIERMSNVWAEYKFDGTRVQLHIDRGKADLSSSNTQEGLFDRGSETILVKTYTRNLENTTHQYPDLIVAAIKQIDAESAILDGEAIGFNKDTGEFLPFQETIQRNRKHNVAESVKNIPLKYFVFDLLYLNGKSLVDLPLRERKAKLKQIVKKGDTIIVDEYLETNDADVLHEYYETAKKKLEGLVVKNPEDVYQAGARSYSWVKLKRADEMLLQDSVDCVVLGYYAGRGARSKLGIGGFLAGIYDPKTDKIKTITKVGTGLTDEEFEKLKKMCDKHKTTEIPANVEMNKIYTPDVIVLPKVVVELGADEISDSPSHSSGYALRFPRLIKFREDKNVTEITTVSEIKQMFKAQKKVK